MKKRCFKFIANERLCKYLRWGYHFYMNPFISRRWVTKKEVLDTFVLFFISLLFSLLLFSLLKALFAHWNVGLIWIFNPILAAVMMLQSALIYGMIFGLCVMGLSPGLGMKFYIQIILQSVRLYAMLMPVFAMLFFFSLVLSVDEFLGHGPSVWITGLNLAALVWIIWIQYDVIIRPVVRYLSPITGLLKGVAVTTVAFFMASVLWQFASISYRDSVYDEQRFLKYVVISLYKEGKIDAREQEELRAKIVEDGLRDLHDLP